MPYKDKTKRTTISIDTNIKKQLDSFKIHENQSISEIIENLAKNQFNNKEFEEIYNALCSLNIFCREKKGMEKRTKFIRELIKKVDKIHFFSPLVLDKRNGK